MPTPRKNATRLVVQTAGMRIIFMSISGLGERDSTRTHAAARTIARTINPITLLDVQPHSGASLIGRISATSHPDNRKIAGQLSLPGVRTGDSGMTMWVATPA